MSVVLAATVGNTYRASFEIPDAAGELRPYAVTVTAYRPLACSFLRLDTGDRYATRQLGPSVWRCACPDFRHRFRRGRSRGPGFPCKHVEAAIGLRALFDTLTPVPTTEPTLEGVGA